MGNSSFGKWLAGIAASVIGALIIWWLTHAGGPFNPTPPPTHVSRPVWTETSEVMVTPLPTATALIDAYGGTWVYPYSASGTLPFALYRLKIANVNAQNGTATFSVCRCTQKDACQSKSNLTPLLASAKFEGSKLVAEPVYIDQQRTVQWTLKAIKVGENLRVTVEQYKEGVRVAGPEDFVLDPGKTSIAAEVAAIDECHPPPEIYAGP